MKYTVRWKKCKKSDFIVSHLEAKMEKFYDFDFVQNKMKVELVYYEKSNSYTTRINVRVTKKGIIRAEAHDKDLITSINETCEKIHDQLRRVKTQFHNKA